MSENTNPAGWMYGAVQLLIQEVDSTKVSPHQYAELDGCRVLMMTIMTNYKTHTLQSAHYRHGAKFSIRTALHGLIQILNEELWLNREELGLIVDDYDDDITETADLMVLTKLAFAQGWGGVSVASLSKFFTNLIESQRRQIENLTKNRDNLAAMVADLSRGLKEGQEAAIEVLSDPTGASHDQWVRLKRFAENKPPKPEPLKPDRVIATDYGIEKIDSHILIACEEGYRWVENPVYAAAEYEWRPHNEEERAYLIAKGAINLPSPETPVIICRRVPIVGSTIRTE